MSIWYFMHIWNPFGKLGQRPGICMRPAGIAGNSCALTPGNQASEQSFKLGTANEEAPKTPNSFENTDLRA